MNAELPELPSEMPLEELALLECLLRIDGGIAIDPKGRVLATRLVRMGLAEEEARSVHLTVAGIERCKSLQHRLASDLEVSRVLVVASS